MSSYSICIDFETLPGRALLRDAATGEKMCEAPEANKNIWAGRFYQCLS